MIVIMTTVLFLCRTGMLDNTSCITVAFSGRDDTIRENHTESILHLTELLTIRTLSASVRYISPIYIKKVQEAMSMNL